jgi:hypothetical protein
MAEDKNIIAKDLNDLSGMVTQIVASGNSQSAVIIIGVLKFECNKMRADDIKNIPNQVGTITNVLGSGSMPPYEYAISCALEVAAKQELINRIQALGDSRLNDVIKKHHVAPADLDLHTVRNALAKVFLEVKLPVLAKFGMFKQTPSKVHHAVYTALNSIGIDNIRTYSDVAYVSAEISKHVQPSVQPPRLSSNNR